MYLTTTPHSNNIRDQTLKMYAPGKYESNKILCYCLFSTNARIVEKEKGVTFMINSLVYPNLKNCFLTFLYNKKKFFVQYFYSVLQNIVV